MRLLVYGALPVLLLVFHNTFIKYRGRTNIDSGEYLQPVDNSAEVIRSLHWLDRTPSTDLWPNLCKTTGHERLLSIYDALVHSDSPVAARQLLVHTAGTTIIARVLARVLNRLPVDAERLLQLLQPADASVGLSSLHALAASAAVASSTAWAPLLSENDPSPEQWSSIMTGKLLPTDDQHRGEPFCLCCCMLCSK